MSWTGFGGGGGGINSGNQNMASGNPSAANYGGGGGSSSGGNRGGASGYNDAGYGSYTRTEGGWVNSYNSAGYNTASSRVGTAEANAAIAASGGRTNPYGGGGSGGGRGGNAGSTSGGGGGGSTVRGVDPNSLAGQAAAAGVKKYGKFETIRIDGKLYAGDNATRAAIAQVQQQRAAAAAAGQPAAAQPAAQPAAQNNAAAQQQAAQQAAQAAEQQRQQQAAAAEAARQEAARQEAARVEQQYQDNLAKVTARAKEIGANSIYGTGNLESQRQYNEALTGLRENDRNNLASIMSDAREAARAVNQKAQESERDKAIGELQGKQAGTSRITGTLSQIGSFLSDPLGTMAGGDGGGRGVGSTLASGAKWGMRGLQALGPAGGIVGFLGGMIADNIDTGEMIENLRGYNPNGLGGVTSAGDLAQQAQDFKSPLWNRNANGGRDSGNKSSGGSANAAAPAAPKPVDKQAMGAINSLIPTSARNALEAGQIASNQYLRALHGRYAKYMLATGAEGSGTSLLQRTAGGQGALGGTSGRLLYSTGGNS